MNQARSEMEFRPRLPAGFGRGRFRQHSLLYLDDLDSDDISDEYSTNAVTVCATVVAEPSHAVETKTPPPSPRTPEPLPEQEVQVLATHEDLALMFECPVCYNTVLPPVTLCCEGHSICGTCKRKVTRCPLCRGKMTEVRNRMMEDMLGKCVVRCRYKDAGCNVYLLGNELAAHQQECPCASKAVAKAPADPQPEVVEADISWLTNSDFDDDNEVDVDDLEDMRGRRLAFYQWLANDRGHY